MCLAHGLREYERLASVWFEQALHFYSSDGRLFLIDLVQVKPECLHSLIATQVLNFNLGIAKQFNVVWILNVLKLNFDIYHIIKVLP